MKRSLLWSILIASTDKQLQRGACKEANPPSERTDCGDRATLDISTTATDPSGSQRYSIVSHCALSIAALTMLIVSVSQKQGFEELG